MVFSLTHACGEVITIAHFSVTKALTFESTQRHFVEVITHLSMLIFFPREPSHSPFPLLCYSFLCSLVSAHDKKECLHWTNSSNPDTSRVSFPLTVVNLKARDFSVGVRDVNNISHHYPEATRVCCSCSLIRLLMTMP